MWRAPLLALLLTSGCYASHERSERDAAPAFDAGFDGGTDAGFDAGALPCFCPGAAACRRPLMCCPVTGDCRDPRSFRCSGDVMECP